MTATNMYSNFCGFWCSLPLSIQLDYLDISSGLQTEFLGWYKDKSSHTATSSGSGSLLSAYR